MREIKFRGWHTSHKKMFSAEEMLEDQLTITTLGEFINVSSSNVRFSTIYPKNKFIPMQYTSLNDENGKEIYEGDIIHGENTYKYIVFYNESECGFYLRKIGNFQEETLNYDCIADYGFEIIGNIYENPELLENSDENNIQR